jgi:hypothetical protein
VEQASKAVAALFGLVWTKIGPFKAQTYVCNGATASQLEELIFAHKSSKSMVAAVPVRVHRGGPTV